MKVKLNGKNVNTRALLECNCKNAYCLFIMQQKLVQNKLITLKE